MTDYFLLGVLVAGGVAMGLTVAALCRVKLPSYFQERTSRVLPIAIVVISGVATGAMCFFVASAYWIIGPSGFPAIVLASVTPTLVATDAEKHLLPNAVLGAATLGEILALVLAGVIFGETAWQALLRGLLGGLAFAAVMLVLALLKTGLGFGDVKLAFPLGVMLASRSWGALLYGAIFGWILAGVGVVVLLLLGRAKRGTMIAYGPYMIIGAWIVYALSVGFTNLTRPLW